MEDLVRENSKNTKERIVSSQLKEVFEEQNVSTQGGTVFLTTGGTPLAATLGKPKKRPPPKFSNESLTRLQLKMGVSDNKMRVVGNYLRVNCGRDSVDNQRDHMMERNKKLANQFTVKNIVQTQYVTIEDDEDSEKKKKKKKKKETQEVVIPVVFAQDVEDLASLIMLERGLTPDNSLVQVGIDDGQGLLKVMLSVKEKFPHVEEKKGKKAKYEDGFAPNDFKLSGVKKLILLLVSPTTERHDNMAALLGELGIEAIDFGFCCDLKMVLVLLGKQAASSKHCCPFCTGSSPWLSSAPSTTIGSLWRDYTSYVEAGSVLKKAMKFNNVVNPPLVTGLDDQKILGDLFYFPEHHVYTGIHGKLVKELERKVFKTPEEGKAFMDRWMASPGVNVARTVYHGSASFIGNMVTRFLKNIDDLQTQLREYLSPERFALAEVFITAFNQFAAVVKACFGQTLSPNYTFLIKEFMATYRSLSISIPLKVHLLESHAEEFLKMKGEDHGLGFYSEQAMESMHKELKQEWGADKVDIQHPSYGPNLKNTVVRINGKHI